MERSLKPIKLSLLLGALILSSLNTARAEFLAHSLTNFHEESGRFSLLPEINYYYTDRNYDPDGDTILPIGLVKYTRINTDIPIRLGLSDAFTLFGRISWSYVFLDQGTVTSESFGLADQTVGFNIRVHRSSTGLALDFQAQADLPTYSNDDAAADAVPALGSGTYDLTGAGFVTAPIFEEADRKFDLVAGAGYTWRSDNFTGVVPWMAALEYQKIPTGLSFGGKVWGVFATESRAVVKGINPCLNGTAGGGSCYVLSQNPSLLAGTANLGYRVSDGFRLNGFISGTFWGKNAPQAIWGGAGFEIGLGGDQKRYRPGNQTPTEYGRSNKGFVNYSFKATVIRVNDRFHIVKINKGKLDGVKAGQVYDIFSVKKSGKIAEAIARGRVTSVKEKEAAIKVTEYFREVWIEEGFIVRRPLK